MAWTTPMTAVANEIWTSSQYNQHVRDNLLETAVAKATAAGQFFVSTAANTVAARSPSAATVLTSQTTSSTSYTDLTTSGPAVTVTTGTKALVHIACEMSNNNGLSQVFMSYAVSSATTVSASDNWCILDDGHASASQDNKFGAWHLHTGLTSGSNIFTAKYKVGSGTGTFQRRHIIVVPL